MYRKPLIEDVRLHNSSIVLQAGRANTCTLVLFQYGDMSTFSYIYSMHKCLSVHVKNQFGGDFKMEEETHLLCIQILSALVTTTDNMAATEK